MICRPILSLRRRVLVAALGVVLAAGTWAAVLVLRGPTQGPETAGQREVIPHLVPDVGGLHSGSHGPSSAPKVTTVNPGIKLIPSAGGPVSLYGGAPGGPTFLPARHKG